MFFGKETSTTRRTCDPDIPAHHHTQDHSILEPDRAEHLETSKAPHTWVPPGEIARKGIQSSDKRTETSASDR